MAKKVREKKFNIQLVNIKLLSNKRKGKDAYKDILYKIHENKISVPVRGGKHAIIRTLFSDVFSLKGDNIDVYYGKFSKYTVIDGKDWINIDTMDVESDVEIPANKFPNLVETDYIFIPEAHRFIIVNISGVNINAVNEFFTEALKQVIDFDEDYEIVIEQSEDIFDEIKRAEIVTKLFIRISYTNADAGNDAFEFIDKQIKQSQIGKLSMDISPDHEKNIQTDTTLISGALDVAKSNGYAVAKVENNGIKKKIETKKHPKTITFKSQEALLRKKAFDLVMGLFRDNN